MARPLPRPPLDAVTPTEVVEVTARHYTWNLLRTFPGVEFDEPRVRVPVDRVELLAGVLEDLSGHQGSAGAGFAMRDLAKKLRKVAGVTS